MPFTEVKDILSSKDENKYQTMVKHVVQSVLKDIKNGFLCRENTYILYCGQCSAAEQYAVLSDEDRITIAELYVAVAVYLDRKEKPILKLSPAIVGDRQTTLLVCENSDKWSYSCSAIGTVMQYISQIICRDTALAVISGATNYELSDTAYEVIDHYRPVYNSNSNTFKEYLRKLELADRYITNPKSAVEGMGVAHYLSLDVEAKKCLDTWIYLHSKEEILQVYDECKSMNTVADLLRILANHVGNVKTNIKVTSKIPEVVSERVNMYYFYYEILTSSQYKK